MLIPTPRVLPPAVSSLPPSLSPLVRIAEDASGQAGQTRQGQGEKLVPGYTAIGPIGSERKARDWSLVLQSIEVWHAVHGTSAGWILLVRDADYERSAASIDHYEVENRDWPPRRTRERPRYAESKVAPIIFMALLAFFLITGPAAGGSRWFQQGSSVAELVFTSEPWRAVTALTLHGDAAHVLGNAVSGTVFASAVYRRLGSGGGTLAVLASGIVGNVANAFWYYGIQGEHHGSIGASTAIFGAIGLLAATQLSVNRSQSDGPPRSWTETAGPIVGGLALLGSLGASPSSDLGAHFFGFVAGLVIGLPAGLLVRRHDATPRRWWTQPALGALAAGLVLGSWQLALYR